MVPDASPRVILAGGTGLVGRALARVLADQGNRVTILSRRAAPSGLPQGTAVHGWEHLSPQFDGAAAVINLAGEGIADHRWTERRMAAVQNSRVMATRHLVSAMRECTRPPAVLVNASAIGYYGPRDEAPVDESAAPGAGFLPEVCRAWEAEAVAASELGVRVVRIRIGTVLAREGGALPKMALPVRWFAGSPLGSGSQGLSWIHLQDLVAMLSEAALSPAWEGAYNGTAPVPLSQGAFVRALAQRVHRPVWPLPAFFTSAALRMALGRLADELLLQGAFVLPTRAQALGFPFRFPTAEAALADLL
jgi:hypothetical protein